MILGWWRRTPLCAASGAQLAAASATDPPNLSKRPEFAIELYRLLRAEIMEYIVAVRNLEFGCIAGMSAGYYFIFNALLGFDPDRAILSKTLLLCLLFLPALLPAFCLLKLHSYFHQMNIISTYLQSIEKSFQSDGYWEVSLEKMRRENRSSFYILGWSSWTAFWLLFIVGLAIPTLAIHMVKTEQAVSKSSQAAANSQPQSISGQSGSPPK